MTNSKGTTRKAYVNEAIRVGEKKLVWEEESEIPTQFGTRKKRSPLFSRSLLYLGNTSTDTSKDGETLFVDILTEDTLVENGVLLVGGKLGGTLRSLDHDGRDDSTVKCTEPTRMKKKNRSATPIFPHEKE